ncbi:MAG: protein kinase [Proteobacteria bacterium]|nr:protein kinase [Pseudomonadota bacterium]
MTPPHLGDEDAPEALFGMAEDPRTGEVIGPYEVLSDVARGGMASVWRVRDTRSGDVCALKLLLPLKEREEARKRFRREFRALGRLAHENVLRVFETGMVGDRPWYTMEYVPGRTLREEAKSWEGLEPADRFARVQAVLVQVGRALAYIHDRGLVHRDVTPANILVRPDGVVKLMDFGVVKESQGEGELTQVGEVIGTVAYISPEQIVGDSVDSRADLYSLGAVLYLMLTGRRPFTARTLQGFLDKHLHKDPVPPVQVDPLVPAHLDEICLRLLRKDPADRYASAHHLLHVLGDVAGSEVLEGWWPPRTVGRTSHKAVLRDALDRLVNGDAGGALLLTGKAGAGKSRLLAAAATYARRHGLAVARGHCRPQDRPFGAFVGVYQALADETAPIILRQVLAGDDDGVIRERYPVISAFKDLVISQAPCVILLDDMHRADPATRELLEYLLRNTIGLSNERVLFVLTAEEGEGRSVIDALKRAGPVQHLDLPPLRATEVEEVVLSLVPSDSASRALAKRVHKESHGNPAFVSDMLRALVDDGLMVEDGARFRIALDPAEITRSKLPIPASMRQALKDRLAPLDEDALRLAQSIALSRTPLDLDVLLRVCPFDEDHAMEALDVLVESGVVSERRSDDHEQVELVQARHRDVLLEDLAEAELAMRHRILGEVLEKQFRDRPVLVVEELAWHFEQAGVAAKAYAYLVQTAKRHLHRSLFEESLSFLDRALRMEPSARPQMLLDDADRRLAEVYLARAQALYHLGQWGEAVEDAKRAGELAALVRDARLQAEVSSELGSQLRNQGPMEEAERHLRLALAKAEEVGDPRLRTLPLYQLGGVVWGRGDLEQAERLWKDAAQTAQRTGDERALGYAFNGLGILAICRGASSDARNHLEQSAKTFERLGMLGALTIARVNLVELYLSTGVLRKALQLADRTVSKAREVNHPHGIALGLAYRAQVLLAVGRLDSAAASAKESLRLVRALGTPEDELLALSVLARVALEQGDSKLALERLDKVELLLEHDSEGIGPMVAAWRIRALCEQDRVDEAMAVETSTPWDTRAWPNIQVRSDLARGRSSLALGDRAKALEVVQRALSVAEANGYRFYQLHAQHQLVQLVEDDATRARHQRVAKALARSLASNLPRSEGGAFLSTSFGEVE